MFLQGLTSLFCSPRANEGLAQVVERGWMIRIKINHFLKFWIWHRPSDSGFDGRGRLKPTTLILESAPVLPCGDILLAAKP
jgi:hypothetical protein